MSDVQETIKERVDQGRRKTADRIGSLGQSMHDATELFMHEDQRLIAGAVDFAAERCEQVARYLKSRNLNDLGRDAANTARSHPAMFLGLAFIGGMALGRFLRSTRGVASGVDGADIGSSDRPFAAGKSLSSDASSYESDDGETGSEAGEPILSPSKAAGASDDGDGTCEP